MASPKQHIVFFHPDLGIGGAERLVIDAAVGLQNRGHKVTIFTSHCDPQHCFDEARDDKQLKPDLTLTQRNPRRARARQHHSPTCPLRPFCHSLRHPTSAAPDPTSRSVLFRARPAHTLGLLCRPAQRWHTPPTLIATPHANVFLLPFPDKLLAKPGGFLKTLYRGPFDWLESWSTDFSDTIVVNSNFTKTIFREAFPSLRHRQPGVVYPCVDTSASKSAQNVTPPWKKKILLSINRFEKKKNVGLAIEAFAGLSDKEREHVRLVIAGGYDTRVAENVATHAELCELADSLKLKHMTIQDVINVDSIPNNISVLFVHSVPNAFKSTLLSSARLLVYTPLHEHFGIVPLEAMLAGTPVLAANEGGPTETVISGQTGWLRDVTKVQDWTEVMRIALEDGDGEVRLKEMGKWGRERVIAEFSKEKMAERLESEIVAMIKKTRPPTFPFVLMFLAIGVMGILSAASLWLALSSINSEYLE